MNKKISVLSGLPDPDQLLNWYTARNRKEIPNINGHIHTPHSFSAFSEIAQAFRMAAGEGVSVLGINDFYTTDGYDEFAELAALNRVFPLFNIEFMALQKDLQESGTLVNDPNNPGRTYFSGKGLRQPPQMSEASFGKIRSLQMESNRQTYEMVRKLNDFFDKNLIEMRFDPERLHRQLAMYLFRERHIAQAIRMEVFKKTESPEERKEWLKRIFSGKDVKSSLENQAALENEIRGVLLKAGGAAFVPEDPKAFLALEEVVELIVDAGGIPCYPVLLDDPKGFITAYESDREKLLNELAEKHVYAIELIPGRNDFHILKDFVSFFHRNGFVVTFGTEHNTPQLDPVKVTCRGGVELDKELKKINYEGTAVIAAHQYLIARGKQGYLDGKKAKTDEMPFFIELGKAVIDWFVNK